MDSNVMKPLATLAEEIRADLARRESAYEDWVEATLSLIMHLAEGRERFPSDPLFGAWLAENGLDGLNKDDRAAALNMAKHPELARLVLEEAHSKSVRTVWLAHMQPRIKTVAAVPYSLSNEKVASARTEPAETPESAVQEPISAPQPVAKTTEQREPPLRTMANVGLVKQYGALGRTVYAWLEHGTTGNRGEKMPYIRAASKFTSMSKKTIKLLAEFLDNHADSLPPARSYSERINLRTFWQEAPRPLVKQTLGSNDERTVLSVIGAWDKTVAPVLEQWRQAGSPADSDGWYVRSRPTPPVVTAPSHKVASQPVKLDSDDPYAANRAKVAELVAAMSASTGLAEDGHDQWPLPPPQPIRVHGLDIWPTTDHRYDWKAAYYAFNLFEAFAPLMQEERLHIRARVLMNPIGPLLSHINGRVGAVWGKICARVHYHPEQAADTFGPRKTLQGY